MRPSKWGMREDLEGGLTKQRQTEQKVSGQVRRKICRREVGMCDDRQRASEEKSRWRFGCLVVHGADRGVDNKSEAGSGWRAGVGGAG